MKEISYNIKSSFLMDENGKCFAITKELDKEQGKSALVIMFSSAVNDVKITDNTSHLLWNNMVHLGYCKVSIWNLFPDYKNRNEEQQKANLGVLKKLLKNNYDSIVIAWGSSKEYSNAVINEKKEVYKLLENVKDKLFQIEDEKGIYIDKSFHPLFAGNYFGFRWKLEPHKIIDLEKDKEKVGKKNEDSDKGNDSSATEIGLHQFQDKLKNG